MNRISRIFHARTLGACVLLSLSLTGCPGASKVINNLPPAVKDLLSSVTAAAGEVVLTGKLDPAALGSIQNTAIRLSGPGGTVIVKPNNKGEFIVRTNLAGGQGIQASKPGAAGSLFRVELVQLGPASGGSSSPVVKVLARLVLPTGTFGGASLFSNFFPARAGTVVALDKVGPRPATDAGAGVAEWTSENNPLATWDTDKDGTPDATDLDDDGDKAADDRDQGLLAYDPTENHDLDGDGTGDNADLDDDNDGTFDWVDADDDNDGTSDASDTDDNGDGYADRGDANGPAFLTRHDIDHDGLADEVDSDDDGDGTSDLTDTDDDGDGTADGTDTDDDNDGILDERDAADGDDDGIADAFDEKPSDAGDQDLVAEHEDVLADDEDLDGTSDTVDTDDDGDGIPDASDTDADNDGVADAEDLDDDGNGVPDAIAGAADTDSDGIPDAYDSDANGDGSTDQAGTPVKDAFPDSDDDGVPDVAEGTSGSAESEVVTTPEEAA